MLAQAWGPVGVAYEGERFHVGGAKVLPSPVQKLSPPISEAVSDAESVRNAAERGHNLLLGTIGPGRNATAEAARLTMVTTRMGQPGQHFSVMRRG